jgi:UDP-glucose 4-epimerase
LLSANVIGIPLGIIASIFVKKYLGPERKGDIPHSLAIIKKAKSKLNYLPLYDLKKGLKESMKWYWDSEYKK